MFLLPDAEMDIVALSDFDWPYIERELVYLPLDRTGERKKER